MIEYQRVRDKRPAKVHNPLDLINLYLRATWFQASQSKEIILRFVVRSTGTTPTQVRPKDEEAYRHADVLLLSRSTQLSKSVGPIQSLLGWWQCAVTAWPRVELIGKAEDDVWIDLRGVAWQLTATQKAIQAQQVLGVGAGSRADLYWGVMETCHWAHELNRAFGFSFKFGTYAPCANFLYMNESKPAESFNWSGPFSFAKGPLFFLSSRLINDLLRGGQFVENVEALTKTIMHRESTHNTTGPPAYSKRLPWDDVFTGSRCSIIVDAVLSCSIVAHC